MGPKPECTTLELVAVKGGAGHPKYIAIREEVLRRHGVEKEPFHRIARDLGVSDDTVRRSWDSTHREEVQAAVTEGRSPNRGRYRHLAAGKIKRMREMIIMADGTSREIAVAVGVSTNTVQRERKRMPPRRNNRASGMGMIYVSARRLPIKLCSTSLSCSGRFHRCELESDGTCRGRCNRLRGQATQPTAVAFTAASSRIAEWQRVETGSHIRAVL